MTEFKAPKSALAGAAFLMATAAVGPGFITQTTVFTQQLKSNFGFVILCSIVLDLAAQLNIWRIITVSGKRAQDLANEALPGLGHLLTVLIVFGGLAFNIGNIAGAGLGMNLVFHMDSDPSHPTWGVLISALLALGIFAFRHAVLAMDRVTRWLGLLMIGLTLLVAWKSSPPLAEAWKHSFWPAELNSMAILTLVGGTVGGYISFAGAHRLLDAGIRGIQPLKAVTRSSIRAILLASLMRILLFLAALGVVSAGVTLDAANPPGSVFQHSLGTWGSFIFGIVLWCAAITSVIGAAYTSISFLRSLHRKLDQHAQGLVMVFILLSTLILIVLGKPVKMLIIAGTVNGFILPVALAAMLWVLTKKPLAVGYRHPVWMRLAGWLVVGIMSLLAILTFF